MSKSWKEKYEEEKKEKIKKLEKSFADIKVGETMYISTPKIIAQYINSIPKNENRTLSEMRIDLAKKVKADKTCPVTTGIFTRIIAERSLELMQEGKDPIAPFWKVVDPKTQLAKKISCGPEIIAKLRRAID